MTITGSRRHLSRAAVACVLALVVIAAGAPATARRASQFGAPAWIERSIPGIASAVTDLQVESGNPSRLSAIVEGSTRIYSSSNGGAGWSSYASAPALPFTALTRSKSTPARFYAMNSGVDVYRRDGSGTWAKVSSFAGTASDIDTSRNSTSDRLVMATGAPGTEQPLQYSTDSATSWNASTSVAMSWGAVAGNPTGSSPFYAAVKDVVADPVYKSTNGGVDWAVTGALPSAVHVTGLLVLPDNGPVLAATDTAAAPACVYRSNNGGTGWVGSSTGIEAGVGVKAMAVSPVAPFNVYLATDAGVYVSYDSGTTWSDITGDLPDVDFTAVTASGGGTNSVYVGAADGSIYELSGLPVIDGISPTSGPTGTSVTLTGSNFGEGGDSYVTFGGARATIYGSWSDTRLVARVPPKARSGDVVVVTPAGESNPVDFTVTGHSSATTWYLAEGSTGYDARGAFETWVLVQNPGDEPVTADITYMTETGAVEGPTLDLEPMSRQSVDVSKTVPNTWSVSTRVESDSEIIAERSMYFNTPAVYRQAATDSIGVRNPAMSWYLAEGSTGVNGQGSFETWVLVQNPGNTPAEVDLIYMTGEGTVDGPSFTLPAQSRKSVNVAETVPNTWSVSTQVNADAPVIAERSMYWNAAKRYRQAAHDSIGVTNPSMNWYLAEGCTGNSEQGGFETWILVQNPGDETAKVIFTFMTPAGEVQGPNLSLAAGSRDTVNVAESVPNEWNVSTKVTSNMPVIAERSMYWNTDDQFRQAATDSIGVTAPQQTWYLAEGCTGTDAQGAFETWVLVQNPGTVAANVELTYMTGKGPVEGPSLTLEPQTRQTVNVSETVPNDWSVSTQVTADQPVIAERAMYWNTPSVVHQAAHDSIGVSL